MVNRVGETSGEQAAHMTREIDDINFLVAKKENEKLEAMNVRLEKVLKAYNEKLKEIDERDRLISTLEK